MKLHILGASGSGVTTLGELLSEKLGLKYFDSDDYFWIRTDVPFTQRCNPIERNQQIADALSQSENWILGGSIIDWGENLFPEFDLIIFLYLPANIRIERLKKREFEKFGNIIFEDKKRAEQFNKYLAWATDYDNDTGIAKRTLKAHQNWLLKKIAPN